jgi:glutamate-1-semialdehyde 2,1-aminomutase
MSTIHELEKLYIENHKKSKTVYERALKVFPSGVSHDGRYRKPFPIYASKALGSRKWDVDGNEYVDLVIGHGSLLFGFGDEKVTKRIQKQASDAIHIGACSELEIEWAELIKRLVPSARKGLVRGTACGSEAVQMAIRLSRAYTRREKIVIHAGSYHGKLDSTIIARGGPPLKIFNVKGIPRGVMNDVKIVPFNNLSAVEKELESGDVACIILHCNALYKKDYVKGLRELSTKYGTIFLMDEVVSGFRYSPGGAQEYYGVTPDLTALGKIVGGGVPVGAICGQEDIMNYYKFDDDYWNKFMRIAVGGTWNCQPISIVGGIEMMKRIKAEKDIIYTKLRSSAERIIKTFNEHSEELGVSAYAYGLPIDDPTTLSINLFKKPVPSDKIDLWRTGPETFEDYKVKSSYLVSSLSNHANYLSLINDGIFSYTGRGGSLSTAHTKEDIEKMGEALQRSLMILKENNLIGKTRAS